MRKREGEKVGMAEERRGRGVEEGLKKRSGGEEGRLRGREVERERGGEEGRKRKGERRGGEEEILRKR